MFTPCDWPTKLFYWGCCSSIETMLALLWCFNWCMMGHPLAAEVVLCRHLQMIAPRMAVPKIPTHQWAATCSYFRPKWSGMMSYSIGADVTTLSDPRIWWKTRWVSDQNELREWKTRQCPIKKHPLLVARMITHFLERIYESSFLMLGGADSLKLYITWL